MEYLIYRRCFNLVCYRKIGSQHAFERKPRNINNTEGCLRALVHKKNQRLQIYIVNCLIPPDLEQGKLMAAVNSRK